MKCPRCNQVELMMTKRQEVEIDFCPECNGIWLDNGELNKIISHYTKKKKDKKKYKSKEKYYEKSYSSKPKKVKAASSVVDTLFDMFEL